MIIEKLLEFRKEREWEQFHRPKDLAISISIEAAELLECFQWKTDEEITAMINSENKNKIQEEIADISLYLHLLSYDLNIDIEKAMEEKIKKNGEKYPVEKSKGTAKKYTEL